MKPPHILRLILLGAAVLGGISAYLDAHGIPEPNASVVGTSIGFSLLTFWWYLADSGLRSYKRSPPLNVAVIAVAFIAIPYYLARSRPRGQRLRAVASMLGFVALVFVAVFIGALPVALVG